MINRLRVISILLLAFLAFPGCSVWRGLPSHGGGKRFDEEQRVVSGAVCRAVTDMDLSELKGRKIMVIYEAVAQNGGGQVTYPHIETLRASYTHSDNIGAELYDFALPDDANFTQYRNNFSDAERKDRTASVDIQPYVSYRPTTYPTDSDLKYLQAILTMKADHLNIAIAPKTPDVMLTVLVDVLGTNLSRRDNLLFWKDELKASCEITYYAKDLKTNRLIFPARQTSAAALYEESSIIGFSGYRIQRSIRSAAPTPYPFDTPTGLPTPTAAEPIESEDEAEYTATPSEEEERSSISKRYENLVKKLEQADIQFQSGNLDEAQRLVDQVRLTDPDFPGLEAMAAKIQSARKNNHNQ